MAASVGWDMKRLRSGMGRFSSSEAFSLFLRLFRFEFLLALENGCMYLYSCKYENLPLNARKPRLYRGFSSVHLFHALKMVPVAGLEPARYRYRWILSYLLHTEYKRTQPPMEVVDGHQKALNYWLFWNWCVKKLRFVCCFRTFQFWREFWILEGHRRDVTPKRSTTAHAIDS